MSRILRRPMFRGGPVSSYGTGIAAPLVPGYRGGGQIGGGIIYGKPMADGRYGFQAPDVNEFKIGAEVVADAPNIFKGNTLTEKQWKEKEKWKNWEPEFQTQEDIQSAYEDAVESEKELLDSLLIEGPLTPDTDHYDSYEYLLSDEGKNKFFQDKKAEQDKKIAEAKAAGVDKTTELNEQVDTPEVTPEMQKLLDRIAFLEGQQSTEKPEVDAKTMVAENKELFRDLLGYKEARGQDISQMLLGFAGAEGDDTWSKAKSFFRDEAKRPGKAQKIDETAAALAINDYVAGKRSKERMLTDKQKIDYAQKVKLDALVIDEDDSLSTVATKLNAVDKDINSMKGLKEVIATKDKEDGRLVYPTSLKLKDILKGNSKKILKNLKEGYNIIDNEGVKWIIKYDGSGSMNGVSKPVTITQFWNQTS